MPNGWRSRSYVQVFYFDAVIFYQANNIFEIMEIYENIHESVVENSYKNLPGQNPPLMVTAVR